MADTPTINEMDDAFLGLNHQDVQEIDGVDDSILPPGSSKRPRQRLDQAGALRMQCRHLNTSTSIRSSSSRKLLRCKSTRSRRGQKVNKDGTTWSLVRHNRKNEEKKSFSQATSPKEHVFVGDGRQRPPSKVFFSQVSSGAKGALFQVPAGTSVFGRARLWHLQFREAFDFGRS